MWALPAQKYALVDLAPYNVSDAYRNENQAVAEEQWFLFAYLWKNSMYNLLVHKRS